MQRESSRAPRVLYPSYGWYIWVSWRLEVGERAICHVTAGPAGKMDGYGWMDVLVGAMQRSESTVNVNEAVRVAVDGVAMATREMPLYPPSRTTGDVP